MAFLHAVLRGTGMTVEKGGGIQGLQVQPVGRGQQVGNGELVIDLIESVRVDHHIHCPGGDIQVMDILGGHSRHGIPP